MALKPTSLFVTFLNGSGSWTGMRQGESKIKTMKIPHHKKIHPEND